MAANIESGEVSIPVRKVLTSWVHGGCWWASAALSRGVAGRRTGAPADGSRPAGLLGLLAGEESDQRGGVAAEVVEGLAAFGFGGL